MNLSHVFFYIVMLFLFIRLPPRSTRTYTLFPYTTLVRSARARLRAQMDDGVDRMVVQRGLERVHVGEVQFGEGEQRSEEHTSELQSLMRTSYAVFCLKKKNI